MLSSFLDEEMLRLHHLIRTRSTGTPQQLADKLGCSVSTLHEKIKLIREHSLPVCYSRHRQCYYYDGEVSIFFNVVLNGVEMQKITGGTGVGLLKSQKYFFTPRKSE